jgi:peptide/nickel transport system ATP-binding protein
MLDASPHVAETPAVAEIDALHVTLRRGDQDIHAIRGMSLDIGPGEILGLVGESGSGKSVLAMSMLGLLPGDARTSGRCLVHGDDMLSAPAEVRRRRRRSSLGAVFQDPMTSLNPTMRIGTQVAEAAESDEEALRLLKAVGIPDAHRRMGAFPHELSGGLRQRVMIAMAVAGSPSLVVADEPTTALDVTVQAQVLALLRSLRDQIGCSFLLITHDLGVAARVADRVAVMYAGRLAEMGPTGVVLREAAHPYSLGLMGSRLSLGSSRTEPLATLPGEVPDPTRPPAGCPFAPRCDLVTDRCAQEPVDPVEVAPGHLSACVLPIEQVRGATEKAREKEGAPPAGTSGHPAGSSAQPQGGVAVDVRRVVKTFWVKAGRGRKQRLAALRDISLTVADGESVAIVGESGSGKSTLLRVIAGLEHAGGGEIALGHGVRPQMVFQDAGASLTPWLTVGDLIGERLRRERMSKPQRVERVAAALAQVGLPADVAGVRAAQLSGGQRQRVALARATVVPPKVLLCDEPTSALDVSLASGVINLIGRLRRELGMAVVFVTHDLSVARIVADRIAVMYLGRIVELGDAEDVVHHPRHPYTRALIGAVPDFGADPPALPGDPASPLRPPPGCSFHPRCPIAAEVCADPDLHPRLLGIGHGQVHQVACIRTAVL